MKQLKLMFFISDSCSVCHALQPKIIHLCSTKFPFVDLQVVNAELSPLLCGQNLIFTFPVVLLFENGKEVWRKKGAMGLNEIEDALLKLSR